MTTRIGVAGGFMRSFSSESRIRASVPRYGSSGVRRSRRPVGDDEADGDARASSGRRIELEATARKRLRAFAHVAEPHARNMVDRDAAAIIDDREADPIRLATERDLDPCRAGVAEHVGE